MSDLPVYKSWKDVPDNLKTKTQLGQEGMKPAKNQQPVALKRSGYHRTPVYHLYDVNLAVPKRVPTAVQLAALDKARKAKMLTTPVAKLKILPLVLLLD